MTDLRNVFQPVRPTATIESVGKQTFCAYAICRRILGSVCACEYSGRTGDDICPERRLASLDAETIYKGEG